MHSNLTRALIGHAFFLALFLFGGAYGVAKAESLVYTDTLPFTRTDWAQSLSIPQFNPTVGILTSVEMTITGQVSGTVGVENRQNNPVVVLVQEQAHQQITLPDNSNLLAGGIVISQSVALTATDGVIDFGGPAGTTRVVKARISGTNRWTAPTTIAPFVGVGHVSLPVSTVVAWTGGGSGNMILELNHFADATVTVHYEYVIPAVIIKKFTNGFDADNPNDKDVPQLQPGTTVTWSYLVTNTGTITVAQASVTVTDSQAGVTPLLDTASDVNGDNQLAPGEVWRYIATGIVQDLDTPTPGTTVVNGCNPTNTQTPGNQPTYFNLGRVTAPGTTASDPSHYCNPPVATIQLEKTVYRGHNGGASCPGGENVADQINAPVTYCFEVTNTGETYLDTLVFTDTILGINLSDLNNRSGLTPLAPNATVVYYYEATMPADARLNTAAVSGNPTDDQGHDIPGLPNPHDEDTAQVTPLPTGATPSIEPTRKVFMPLVRK